MDEVQKSWIEKLRFSWIITYAQWIVAIATWIGVYNAVMAVIYTRLPSIAWYFLRVSRYFYRFFVFLTRASWFSKNCAKAFGMGGTSSVCGIFFGGFFVAVAFSSAEKSGEEKVEFSLFSTLVWGVVCEKALLLSRVCKKFNNPKGSKIKKTSKYKKNSCKMKKSKHFRLL